MVHDNTAKLRCQNLTCAIRALWLNVRYEEDENLFISDTYIWYGIMQLMLFLVEWHSRNLRRQKGKGGRNQMKRHMKKS